MTKMTEKQIERKVRKGELEMEARNGMFAVLYDLRRHKAFTVQVLG